MRHGMRGIPNDGINFENPNLGCYFCNDIVSPTDVKQFNNRRYQIELLINNVQ